MNRAVVFLDVLGFKQMIDTLSLEQLATKYEQMIDNANALNTKLPQPGRTSETTNSYCKHFIFSDSIILIANDDSDGAFIDIVLFTWKLLQVSIVNGMPLRGAITYGEIYVNENKNIVLGKALTNAYLLEGQQDWIGVIFDKIVIQRYQTLLKSHDVYDELLYNYNVPLKEGKTCEFRVLNWRLNLLSSIGIKPLFKNPEKIDSVQQKIDNTLAFSSHIANRGNLYSQIEPFHNMHWYGDPPPFKPPIDGY